MAAGEGAVQYEGMWGRPARWWRKAVLYVPALASLNGLPMYSIAGPLGLLAVLLADYLLMLLVMLDPAPLPKGKENEMRWIIYDGDVDAVWAATCAGVSGGRETSREPAAREPPRRSGRARPRTSANRRSRT